LQKLANEFLFKMTLTSGEEIVVLAAGFDFTARTQSVEVDFYSVSGDNFWRVGPPLPEVIATTKSLNYLMTDPKISSLGF